MAKPLSCCQINKDNVNNYTFVHCGRYLKGYDINTPIPVTIEEHHSVHGEMVESHPSYGQLYFQRSTSNKNVSCMVHLLVVKIPLEWC